MTVATIQAPVMSLASTACNSDSLFSLLAGDSSQQVSIQMSASASSYDWSDFPIVYQGTEDMPVPSAVPGSESPQLFFSSPQSVSKPSPFAVVPTMHWEIEDDADDTISFSISSDDETVSDTQEAEAPVNRRADRESVVKFSPFMEIRTHPVVLGDHPCCSRGLALELGWEHQEEEVVDFDLYESSRQCQRRRNSDLRLSYWQRRNLLEASTGLSEQELVLQEQRSWREQLDREAAFRDRAPSRPSHSCQQSSILKKVSSTNTLSCLCSV